MKPTFLDKQVESKSRLNLLFSVPVITVAESYNLNDEEKDFLTNHEELCTYNRGHFIYERLLCVRPQNTI